MLVQTVASVIGLGAFTGAVWMLWQVSSAWKAWNTCPSKF